jgi:transcription initiation factor TFIIE subunit beta
MPAAMSGLTDAMKAMAAEASTLSYSAVSRLKDRYPKAVPYQEMIDYLLPNDKQSNTELIRYFRLSLQKNPEVSYDIKSDTYRYKPPYDIASAEELIAELQRQDLYKGIHYDELKQGWANCLPVLNQLAEEHKILIHRHKKDKQPKIIWANDPALYVHLDDEFLEKANLGSKLPDADKIRLELGAMQSRAAGETQKPVVAANAGKKGQKKVRRGQKVTNTHMQALDAIMKGYGKK